MKTALIILGVVVGLAIVALLAWRQVDAWAMRGEMERLRAFQPADPPRFSGPLRRFCPAPA